MPPMPSGGVNLGWKPPAANANNAFGPPRARSRMSPSTGMPTMFESTRLASIARPLASMVPSTSAWSRMIASCSNGSVIAMRPRITTPMSDTSTPMVAATSVGVPQPSFSIGPTTKLPGCDGKQSLNVASRRSACETGSLGNRSFDRSPERHCRRERVGVGGRFTPTSPPTPTRVNPNESWIAGVNSAARMTRSENGSVPSTPNPVTDTGPSCAVSTPRHSLPIVREVAAALEAGERRARRPCPAAASAGAAGTAGGPGRSRRRRPARTAPAACRSRGAPPPVRPTPTPRARGARCRRCRSARR